MVWKRTYSPAALLTVGCTLGLLGVAWTAARSTPNADSPRQVAETLDRLVQPRFRENAGRFGVDRVIIGGHDNIYELNAQSAIDRGRLHRVKNARRPFVLAFLHCVHKPGKNVGAKRSDPFGKDFKPYLDVLAVGTKTQSGADKLHDWGDAHMEKLAAPHLAQLKRGAGAETESGNWHVVMRPVRASRDSCLGCHAGARRGDTLGVMVYAIDKNTNLAPLQTIQAGGD